MKIFRAWMPFFSLVFLFFFSISDASAFFRIKNSSEQPLILNHLQPFFYNIYETISFKNITHDQLIDILEAQYEDWAQASKNALDFRFFGMTLEDVSYVQILDGDAADVDFVHTHRVFPEDWSELLSLSKTAIAVTLVYNQGKSIIDADIVYNNFRYEFCQDVSECKSGQMHLPSIALHEIGHQLGFDHQNYNVSIMDAHIGSRQDRILSEDDIFGAICSYAKDLVSTQEYLDACSYAEDENQDDQITTPIVTNAPTTTSQPVGSSCGSLGTTMNSTFAQGSSDFGNMGQPLMIWMILILLLGWTGLRKSISVSAKTY